MKRTVVSYIAMIMLAGQFGMTLARADPKNDQVKEEVPTQQAQFSSEIQKIKAGIREDEKYHVDALLHWKYEGKETIPGPITWTYSICFGSPAKDDAEWACYGGGLGKTRLEKVVTGSEVSEEISKILLSRSVMIKDKVSLKGGRSVPMRGYQPHISIDIDANGATVYKIAHLLAPITDYPK